MLLSKLWYVRLLRHLGRDALFCIPFYGFLYPVH